MKRLLVVLFLVGCAPVVTTTVPTVQSPTFPIVTIDEPSGVTVVDPQPPVSSDSAAVLALVNQARAANGLSPLQSNAQLQAMADQMGALMRQSGQMDHGLGGGFQARLNGSGYKYRSAGENIAMGQTTPAQVMTAWMNSSGHRANILGAYKDLGVSHNGSFWCQDFGQPSTGAAEARDMVLTPAVVEDNTSSVRLEHK